MASVMLRVRCKSDSYTIKNLKEDSTCEELLDSISSVSGLRKTCFRVLSGFPPRALDLSHAERTLWELGIKSNDVLIVETLGVVENLQRNFQSGPCPTLCDPLGIFMKKVMPADNSCLFTSVYFIISEGVFDVSCAKAMRKIIRDVVHSDQDTYSAAVLGKSNKDYRHWILEEDSWGGAIELAILSSHFGLELAIVDAQTGRIDRFGEDHRFPCRGFLLYSGIHYDPLFLEESGARQTGKEAEVPSCSVRTLFSSSDDLAFQMAQELGAEAKRSHQYTDTQRFALRCLICNARLTGQQEAIKHVQESGHARFDEVVEV